MHGKLVFYSKKKRRKEPQKCKVLCDWTKIKIVCRNVSFSKKTIVCEHFFGKYLKWHANYVEQNNWKAKIMLSIFPSEFYNSFKCLGYSFCGFSVTTKQASKTNSHYCYAKTQSAHVTQEHNMRIIFWKLWNFPPKCTKKLSPSTRILRKRNKSHRVCVTVRVILILNFRFGLLSWMSGCLSDFSFLLCFTFLIHFLVCVCAKIRTCIVHFANGNPNVYVPCVCVQCFSARPMSCYIMPLNPIPYTCALPNTINSLHLYSLLLLLFLFILMLMLRCFFSFLLYLLHSN